MSFFLVGVLWMDGGKYFGKQSEKFDEKILDKNVKKVRGNSRLGNLSTLGAL
jgi:hypothetical protein